MHRHSRPTPAVTGLHAGLALAALALTTAPRAQSAADAFEEIIVTASRIEEPRRRIGTSVSVVSGAEIGLRGYESVADVLRTQPGVSVTDSAGQTTALRIRGEEGYRTLLMIDGVRVSDPTGTQSLPGFAGLLTTPDIERIEILRGPQGFIYGADAGGVVNIMTRAGAGRPQGRVGLERGAYGTRRLDASLAGGTARADYYVSVTDLDTDGFNARKDDTSPADDDGSENSTIHARFGWHPSAAVGIGLVARDVDSTVQFDGCFSPLSFAATNDCLGRSDQKTVRLSADWAPGRLSHEFAYSTVEIERENLSAGLSAFTTAGRIDRLEYTGTASPDSATTLVFGAELQAEKITAGDPARRDQNAYYLEYQHSFADRFHVSAGARRDDSEGFGTHTSTRLSAAWVQPLGGGRLVKYRASYGTGFRAPSLFEAAYNDGPFAYPPAGGTTLVEETSEGYDVGIDFVGASGIDLSATWFDQTIGDEIYFDLIGYSGYLQSSGESRSKGLEITARTPIGDRIELIGNLTLNETEDVAGLRRFRRPDTLANLGLIYQTADQALRLSANYRISRDAIDIGGAPLDDYGVLDLSVARSFGERLELHARLENAADRLYVETAGFNTPGRSAFIGVRLTF